MLTVLNVEQTRRQNSRTQETQENRCTDQVVGHIFTVQFDQSLSECGETFAQLRWEIPMTQKNNFGLIFNIPIAIGNIKIQQLRCEHLLV